MRRVAEELDYFPNLSARAMSGGKTSVIGLILSEIKYASRTSIRQDVARCCAPEAYWDAGTVEGMSAEERAVMFGPASAPIRDDMHLKVNEDGTVALVHPENAQIFAWTEH